MTFAIPKNCLKIDRPDAKAMIQGYLGENGEKTCQTILPDFNVWHDVVNMRFPLLITTNKGPTRFRNGLSSCGRRLNSDDYQPEYKYIAHLDSVYYINNDMRLWEEVCSNGLLNIWKPETPFSRFADSNIDESNIKIFLLRLWVIKQNFSKKVSARTPSIDHLNSKSRNISILGPLITGDNFKAIRNLLDKSTKPYLTKDIERKDEIPASAWPLPAINSELVPETDNNWTDEELRAAVDAYSWMLRQEIGGQPYEKSTVNHSLRDGALRNRSKGSVEYRMQNISAVLLELGLPWINGYKPSGHVGDRVTALITEYLEEFGITEISDFKATPDPKELEVRTLKLLRSKLPVRPTGNYRPVTRTTLATQYERDPKIKAWVLNNAAGKCELCTSLAPFTSRDGTPYLEVHHVVPLASGGSDTIENAVALCPNCHRRCHHSADAVEQVEILTNTITRLIVAEQR